MPVHPVRVFHFGREVGLLGFELLHADNVRARGGDVVEKAFFIGGADAVYIGGDDFEHER